MSSWAQSVLDATYESVQADTARIVPASGADAFQVRIFLMEPEEALDMGLRASPILPTRIVEVRKSEWQAPVRGDQVELLSDVDGSVTETLMVQDQPLSLDPKRLTWSITCARSG